MPVVSDLPPWLVQGVAVALGLTFGSFLNVVIHRMPRGENLAFPPSRCPACKERIAPYDNLPIISWLFLRGRARCCGTPISPRYPLVELIGGLIAWAIAQHIVLALPADTTWWRAALVFVVHLGLGLGLVAAIFIDLEHMYLPDEITLGGAVLGLVSVPVRAIEWTEAFLGAAVGFLVVYLPFVLGYRLVRGYPGMGLGDAKLLLLAGAWFGWVGALFALLAGAVQGTLVALVVLVTRGRIEEPEAVVKEREELRRQLESAEGKERERLEREFALDPLAHDPEEGLGKARLAFGPFLAIGILEYMFFGDYVVGEYLWLISGN